MRLRSEPEGDLAVVESACRTLFDEAEAAGYLECCGVLLGQSRRVTAVRPASNVHPTPRTHFEIDPQALIDAHREERAGGPQVIGYYHSHPLGTAMPSDTDRSSSARDGKIWAIIGYDGLQFWEDAEDGFRALSYAVIGG